MAKEPTDTYCDHCKDWRPCKVLTASEAKKYDGESEPKFTSKDFPDIRWYRRVRECLECGSQTSTAELDTFLARELIALRQKVQKLEAEIGAKAVEGDRLEAMAIELAEIATTIKVKR